MEKHGKQSGKKMFGADLDAILGQVGFEREHFACVHVGIMSFFKGFLQLLQLIAGEYRPTHTN